MATSHVVLKNLKIKKDGTTLTTGLAGPPFASPRPRLPHSSRFFAKGGEAGWPTLRCVFLVTTDTEVAPSLRFFARVGERCREHGQPWDRLERPTLSQSARKDGATSALVVLGQSRIKGWASPPVDLMGQAQCALDPSAPPDGIPIAPK